MSWEDYDYEERPRRRRRYDEYCDYDDYDYYDRPVRRSQRPRDYEQQSGAVTAVAVFNFVMGSIMLIFGGCVFMIILALSQEVRRQGMFNFFVPGLGVAIVFTLAFLIWGSLVLIAGFGVLNRKQWGRILTLVLGPIGFVTGAYMGIQALIQMSRNPNPFGLFLLLGGAFLLIIHCVLAYAILLTGNASAEFD